MVRFQQRLISLQLEVSSAITYAFLNSAFKVCVLMLYRRIFSLREKYFRIGWWLNIGFTLVIQVQGMVGILRQCGSHPVSSLWKTPSSCPAQNYHYMVWGFINALTDLLILLLPIYPIWTLQMPPKRKIAISGIFSLGLMYIVPKPMIHGSVFSDPCLAVLPSASLAQLL